MPGERPCILSPPKERRVYQGLDLVHVRADGKRWSNILAENKENTASASTPKRLKQDSRSSSTDSDRYFNQCTIQANVQINVTYNK
ncbi:unnamed protein product [Coregonus sp. 'balchen']|nr:unnamed protein product [Coregonus sp. 'balchen']